MKRIIIFSLIFVYYAAVYAIVPPVNKNVKIPADMLANIKNDPGYYMPGKGLTGQIENFKKEKAKFRTSGFQTNTYQSPYLQASIPILCGQYSDINAEWPVATMQQKLFGNWSTGSMTDYYDEISYGQFKVDGGVYGWYPLTGTWDYYKRDNDTTGELLRDLFTMSDVEVDYGIYDNDGPDGIPNSGDDDGYVDVIGIIHSGGGGEEGGPAIWSHSWQYRYYFGNTFQTNDSAKNGGFIQINDYIIQPAMQKGGMVEIGVFCHEFGHALGLPDLYDRDDTGDTSEGVGNWCLMAGGSWGGDGNSAEKPAQMSAWCKEMLGWIDPVVLDQNVKSLQFPAVEDTSVVFKVWTNGNIESFHYVSGLSKLNNNPGKEYYLIENRQKKNFDVNIEGSGLMIWHIDNSVKSQNDDENHKLVDLEAADGRRDMDFGRNSGDDGDPFPGSSNSRAFNRISEPNSNDYNNNYTKVAVSNISNSSLLMTADVSVNANDLAFDGYELQDTAGNNNGFLDPGETAQLIIELNNFGPSYSFVEAVLRTDDSDITINDSTAVFYNVTEDAITANSTDSFEISAATNALKHPVNCELVLSTDTGFTTNFNIIIMMDNIYILLVDDSRNETNIDGVRVLDYYEKAIKALNITYYDVWQVLMKGSPSIQDLSQYGTVIWFTGSQNNTLALPEVTALQSFLDNGGHLFISGQNLGRDLVENGSLPGKTFYESYLHAKFIKDTSSDQSVKMLTGIDEDPISGDYTSYFFITEGDGANNNTSPSIIEPLDGAVPVFNYFGTGLMGKNAAIRYSNDTFKVVYFAFSFEGLNEFGSKNITRKDLMKKVIDWLQGTNSQVVNVAGKDAEKVVNEFALMQNYPNPFNPETTIQYALPKDGLTKLVIYDVLGREINTLVNKVNAAGSHNITWDGKDNTGIAAPSGIYFYRIEMDNYSQVRKMVLVK